VPDRLFFTESDEAKRADRLRPDGAKRAGGDRV